MATIQVRGNAFRALVRRAGLKPMSGTFETREEAQKWADDVEARIAAGLAARGEVILLSTPVSRLITRYVQEVTPTKRGARSERQMLGSLVQRYAVFEKPIASFTHADIELIRDARLTGRGGFAPVANGTVIREMGMLSACFAHAIEEWSAPWEVNPVHKVKRPKAPEHRDVRITDADAERVIAAFGYVRGTKPVKSAHWVAWSFLFGVETAMRRGEILGMQWRDVFAEEKRVHLPKTKNGSARNVPLSSGARALLALLDRGEDAAPVVPLGAYAFGTAWNRGRNASGLRVCFHDTRHEATSRIARKVHNVIELKKITGHKSTRMLEIYFNPTVNELADMLG